MRARLVHIGGIVAVAAFALGGCGDDADPGALASLVPPDAPLYAEAVLRPDGDQREAIESLVERVAGVDDPGGRLIEEIDESLAESPGDFTYADDIEPWLGERGAFFVRSFEGEGMEPDAAALVEVTDTEAAQEFIDRGAESEPEEVGEERSYGGSEYLTSSDDDAVVGLIGEAMVVGTEASFKVAVDASSGESLAESEEYATRTQSLDSEALATVYLEAGAAIEAAIASRELDQRDVGLARQLLAGPLSDPLTIGLSAADDAVTLDAVASVEDAATVTTGPSLLEDLPAGSWLAAAIPDLGPLVQRMFDQISNSGAPGAANIEQTIRARTGIDLRDDVTRWLGDAALFARGTGVPGVSAGVVVETSDPDGPRKLVRTIQALAERDSGLRSTAPPEGADYGFSLGIPGVGAGAEVGVIGDRLVATFGATVDQVLEPEQTLASDDRFQAAADRLGKDFPAAFFLDIAPAVALAEAGADADSPDYDAARPYVEALGAMVAGSRIDDELLVSRLMVTLAE